MVSMKNRTKDIQHNFFKKSLTAMHNLKALIFITLVEKANYYNEEHNSYFNADYHSKDTIFCNNSFSIQIFYVY